MTEFASEEDRTTLSDLFYAHHIARSPVHKAALARRIRDVGGRLPDDPAPTPQEPAASPPAPADEPPRRLSAAEVAERRRFEVLSWTGEHLLDDQR